ncbi:MAG: agmatinase [Bacteriovoracaceae bacterium]|nr:agmatinase [Bacteriovoracaceae bacterium]
MKNLNKNSYPIPFAMDPSRPFFATKVADHFYANSIHLLGFCYDGTTSFRPGSRFGPDAIRDAAFGLETYSPYLEKDMEDFSIYDLGNIPFYPSRQDILHDLFAQATESLNLKENNIRIVTLGGEHSISYSPITLHMRHYPDLVILHLDAHTDLRKEFMDDPLSHASVIYRVWEKMNHQSQELIQYGIRSGQKTEFDFMKQNKTLRTSLDTLIADVQKIPDGRPIYLTLDLDFFDPGYFPGTGTPEAGGENFGNFMKILKILDKKNFVGADVVELAPHLDASHNSSCFAAKVTREIMLALKP